MPFTHVSGDVGLSPASSTHSKTWLSFLAAYGVYKFGVRQPDGIGFVLTADDPYTAFDLDVLSEWPQKALPLINSIKALGFYAETTPSGDGLRVWIRGCLPQNAKHKRTFGSNARVEAYDQQRFLTVTGHAVAVPGETQQLTLQQPAISV